MMAAAAAGSCAFVRAFSSGPDQPRLALALLPKYARATQGHRLPPRYAVQGPPRAPGLHMPVWVGVHGGGGHVRHVLSCRERCGVRRPLGACPHPRAAPGHPTPAPWPGTRSPGAPRWCPGVPGAARLSLGSLTGRRLDCQTGHHVRRFWQGVCACVCRVCLAAVFEGLERACVEFWSYYADDAQYVWQFARYNVKRYSVRTCMRKASEAHTSGKQLSHLSSQPPTAWLFTAACELL